MLLTTCWLEGEHVVLIARGVHRHSLAKAVATAKCKLCRRAAFSSMAGMQSVQQSVLTQVKAAELHAV